MTSALENRILRLEARCEIEDLITDLARAFDAGPSAEQLRPLFTDDAVFTIDRYDRLAGADAIAQGVAGNADQGFKWTLHYLVSPKIALAPGGDRAEVEFMLWEVATAASGRAYWIGGRYVATAQRSAARWQFRTLELQADLISHYPDGWQAKPEALSAA